MTSLDAGDRIGIALGWLAGALILPWFWMAHGVLRVWEKGRWLLAATALTGCAALGLGQPDNLFSLGCAKTYEGDIIVLTCNTEAQVTKLCAKYAKVSDQGFMWDREGYGPNGEYIGACTRFKPSKKDYPFTIIIPREKAWLRSHEEGCHVALYRKYGLSTGTGGLTHAICSDYGSEWERKRKRL